MCIISIAPAGTEKNSETWLEYLTYGLTRNDDGYGFVVKKANSDELIMNKGFFQLKELFKCIENIAPSKEDLLIVHGRIRTSGNKDIENCHPFVLSDDHDKRVTDSLVTKDTPVMFHNGVFMNYTDNRSPFSDTYHSVEKFFGKKWMVRFLMENPKEFKETFNPILQYQRLAFVLPNTVEPLLIGGFETSSEGYIFSNGGYCPYHKKYAKEINEAMDYAENRIGFRRTFTNRNYEPKTDAAKAVDLTLSENYKGSAAVTPDNIRHLPVHIPDKTPVGKTKEKGIFNDIVLTAGNAGDFIFIARFDEHTRGIKQGHGYKFQGYNWSDLNEANEIEYRYTKLKGLVLKAIIQSEIRDFPFFKMEELKSDFRWVLAPGKDKKYEDLRKIQETYSTVDQKQLGKLLRSITTTNPSVTHIRIGKVRGEVNIEAVKEFIAQWALTSQLVQIGPQEQRELQFAADQVIE